MDNDGYKFLVGNKREWQMWREGGWLVWTDAEIDAADETGLIGIQDGVKCYLSRPVAF